MTFTAVSPGQLVKASVTNANSRHVGRLGDDMIPMDTAGAGTDNTLDLGSLLYQWANLYLTGKIYVNGTEFKGGGSGGGGVTLAENKSHLEKQGINYPYSDPGILNESYTNTSNVVLTLRKAYANPATALIADINAVSIDAMTTVWTAGTNTPTIATESTITLDGTSIKMSKSSLPAGNMTMYKSFTAFSLVEKQIAFSLYLDTLSNVTRAFITLESTAGNDKTWYIPVGSLTAATWAHITVNPNLDTSDASTGTFVPGSVTKITFGVTVSNSQTILSYWDIVNSVDAFTIVYSGRKYQTRIWDATNSEWLYVNSVAGTGIHQRNTYTISVLTNNYAVSGTYAKQRNVTIAGNKGIFPSALSGAIAKKTYDIKEYWLTKLVSNADVPLSWLFFDDEFKVSNVSSSTATKISSSTDKKAYFKAGDEVIAFQKQYTGLGYQNKYNATVTINFKILLLSIDSTYGSSEIELTHATTANTGIDNSTWYIVRYSVKRLAALMVLNANTALSYVTPLTFIAKYQQLQIFLDDFNRADGAPGNGWTSTGGAYSKNWLIASNEIWSGANDEGYNTSDKLIRTSEDYTPRDEWLEVAMDIKMAIGTYGKFSISLLFNSTDTLDVAGGTGAQFNGHGPNLLEVLSNGAVVAGASVAFTWQNLVWYKTKTQLSKNRIRIKVWQRGADEPIAWNVDFGITPLVSANILKIYGYGTQSTGGGYGYIDNFMLSRIGNGYSLSGKVTGTGDKVVDALEYSRQDTTNQNPDARQFDGYVPGLTE